MVLNLLLQFPSFVQALPSSSAATIWFEALFNPFVLAIVFLFFLTFFRLVRYIRELPEQRAALDQVVENYREVESKQESDAELIKQGLLSDVNPGSLVAERVFELQRMNVRG